MENVITGSDQTPPLLRRIGIIGDVHGQHLALEAVLAFLKDNGPLDAILCTGDLPGKNGEGKTARGCELLQEHDVLTIRGNHDHWAYEFAGDELAIVLGDEYRLPPEALAYLGALPKTRTFETPIGSLLLCHGCGTDFMAGIYPGDDYDSIRSTLKARQVYGLHRVMIAGHTHERMMRRVGTVLLINAGTLLWNKDPGFMIADFEAGTVTVYPIEPFGEVNPFGQEIGEPRVHVMPLGADEI